MKALAWSWMLLCLALAGCSTAQQTGEAGSSASPPPQSAGLPLTGGQASGQAGEDAVSRGRDLFRNKGCVTCHVNDRVEGESGVMDFSAPDLSNYANDPDFLRRWLADPQEVRPGTSMPDLRLAEDEIEDLIALLNSE